MKIQYKSFLSFFIIMLLIGLTNCQDSKISLNIKKEYTFDEGWKTFFLLSNDYPKFAKHRQY